ncbi:MAG: hypothetical protein AAGF31_01530 [Planctomycetota bacterium]
MFLVGYLSTATVLSAVIGFGYLWQTRRLDDEKLFRIVALVHDVDIDALAAEQEDNANEVPPEEPSLDDIAGYQAIAARNFEVKNDALKRGSDAFNHAFRRLKTATDHFSELSNKIETELKSQGELSSKEAISKVVRDLELLGPEEAKQQLLRTLDDKDGMNDVILLMNAMSTGKLKSILKKFKSQEELDALHEIHRVMLSGGPQAQGMEAALRELQSLKSQRP